MNFRLNLAVALAAAMTFACADKADQQAAIPELEEAMKAPPGAKVLGLYRMDVTPVEGTNGKQFYMEAVPVSKTGAPAPGSVTVLGTFSAILPAGTGPGPCATSQSITAAPVITNRTVDFLSNVWVDVVTLPAAGLTACTWTPPTLSSDPPAIPFPYFTTSDQALGVWKYNNLAAAASPGAAGGSSAPIITGAPINSNPTGVWGFRWTGAGQGLRFFFRIVANANTPMDTGTGVGGPLNPLTWTVPAAAGVVPSTRVQICTADMSALATAQANCTVAPVVNQLVANVANAGSFTPTAALGLVDGNLYWYRFRNDYGAPKGESTIWSEWYAFNFLGPVTVTPAPLTFAANQGVNPGFTAYLTWTTTPAVPEGWVVLCSPTCPAAGPVNGIGAVGVLLSQPVLGTNGAFTTAPTSVAGLLARDVSGYLSTVTPYQWRVYAYDGLTIPDFANAFTAGTLTVTPVTQPVVVTSPAAFSLTPVAPALIPTWPVTWTADAAFTGLLGVGTNVQICLPDCVTANTPGGGGAVILTPVFSATTSYTADLYTILAPTGLIAGDTFEWTIQNGDLAGIFPAAGTLATVTP